MSDTPAAPTDSPLPTPTPAPSHPFQPTTNVPIQVYPTYAHSHNATYQPMHQKVTPWLAGVVECLDCGCEWAAAWPMGADALECPDCAGTDTVILAAEEYNRDLDELEAHRALLAH
jgi:hypothetical protein